MLLVGLIEGNDMEVVVDFGDLYKPIVNGPWPFYRLHHSILSFKEST